MITQRCINPTCNATFMPDADHRFGGCCSAKCARAMTPAGRSTASRSRTPNTALTVIAPLHPKGIAPRLNRKPGTDNRKVSGE